VGPLERIIGEVKRILHTLWNCTFGGIERLLLDLAASQREVCGYEVEILVCRAEGELLPAYRASGHSLHTLGLRHGADLSPGKIWKAATLMRGVDLVHMHSFTPALGGAACMTDTPVLYTVHGNFGWGEAPQVRTRIKWLGQQLFLNHAVSYISFNSRFTQSEAERRFGLTRVPRGTVYNGIDLAATQKSNAGPVPFADTLKGRFVVGTTSRFVGFKRIDRLIEGFALFSKSCTAPGPRAILLLVGDGPLRSEYERQIRLLGIEKEVVFAGYQARVHELQRAMDVCVFPSQSEPFGLVAIETMAQGKPTIVFQDSGGMREVLGGAFPRDVVPDAAGLSSRLMDYYERGDPESLQETRRAFAAGFDIGEVATRFAGIYRGFYRHKG
jgi:L-malate glycosyltransferase